MPTYEYECSECGDSFEAFQNMTDPPLEDCRECGATGTVARLIGAGAGLIFKGSGFYETDYKRAGADKGGGAGKSDTAEKAKDTGSKDSGSKDTGKKSKDSKEKSSKSDSKSSASKPSKSS